MKNLLLLFCLASFYISNAQETYFPPTFGDEWETTAPSSLGWCEDKIEGLNTFLDSSNTKAFIVLKDGKIVLESYMNDFELGDSWYWASAGKTMTAFLAGKAQEESFLDINAKTSDYLGEGWTNCTLENEQKITVRHQLTMTTGLNYFLGIDCTDPACLECLNEPGEQWFYHNAPYTLITEVIDSATNMDINVYLFNKLTLQTGIGALYSYIGQNRVLFSQPRSMARFGLLIENNGDWNGNEIMSDKAYMQDMISTSQDINPSYGYLWWLNGKESFRLPGTTITYSGQIIPEAPSDAFAAIGKNGQILLIVPSQNLVIVRMGDNPDESLVPNSYVNELWNEFAKVQCTTSTENTTTDNITLYPNPVKNQLTIQSDTEINSFVVYSVNGERILQGFGDTVDTSSLNDGMYVIRFKINENWQTRLFSKK